jgi:hypothetical protein
MAAGAFSFFRRLLSSPVINKLTIGQMRGGSAPSRIRLRNG